MQSGMQQSSMQKKMRLKVMMMMMRMAVRPHLLRPTPVKKRIGKRKKLAQMRMQ